MRSRPRKRWLRCSRSHEPGLDRPARSGGPCWREAVGASSPETHGARGAPGGRTAVTRRHAHLVGRLSRAGRAGAARCRLPGGLRPWAPSGAGVQKARHDEVNPKRNFGLDSCGCAAVVLLLAICLPYPNAVKSRVAVTRVSGRGAGKWPLRPLGLFEVPVHLGLLAEVASPKPWLSTLNWTFAPKRRAGADHFRGGGIGTSMSSNIFG